MRPCRPLYGGHFRLQKSPQGAGGGPGLRSSQRKSLRFSGPVPAAHHGSGDGPAGKKKQVKFFTNPELCDITEDLVLTEPYLAQPMNPRNKNIVTPGNEDFVREHLYEDEASTPKSPPCGTAL